MANRNCTTVREAIFPGDAPTVSRLVGDYLRQTEAEKAERDLAEPRAASGPSGRQAEGMLPPRYQAEIDDPVSAFGGSTVLLAEQHGVPTGLVVLSLHRASGDTELKRLWVDPARRGSGAGSALLAAAAERAGGSALRLSVWSWRADALRAYERAGFAPAPSWETRPDLVCLRRAPASRPRESTV